MTERADTSQQRWTPGAAFALGAACVLWAASSVAAKVALGEGGEGAPGKVGPFTLGAMRFGVGGLLLAVLSCRGEGWRSVDRGDRASFVGLGVLGIALTYAVFYGGMQWTTAIDTTLLVAAEPVLIAVLARLLLGEQMSPRQMTGMGMGLVGVYLVVMRGVIPRFESTVVANLLVTAALIFESLSSIIGKHLSRGYPGLQVASLGMIVGASALAPFMVWEFAAGRSHMPGVRETAAILYLTLVCSAVCYGIWYSLLKRYTVSSMAGFLFIQPLVGPLLAFVLLGERVGPWSAAGAALVMGGVWLVAASGQAAAGHKERR